MIIEKQHKANVYRRKLVLSKTSDVVCGSKSAVKGVDRILSVTLYADGYFVTLGREEIDAIVAFIGGR
jgi:hypothetical protein